MKKILSLSLLASCALAVAAQNTQSGFFNDGYMFRHNMNPAIANRQSYIAIPVLSNLSISERGNIGLGDLVYSRGGETVSFMHPSVGTEEAVKPFADKLRLENDIRLNLLSVGVAGKKGRGYTTVGASLRSHIGGVLPGQLLRLAKEGPANQTYDLSNLNLSADAFAEIAVGHSHKIGDNLSVGAKAKLLLGLGHIDATAEGTQLTLGEDAWEATANAEVNASVKGLSFLSETEMRGPEGQQTPHTYISDVDFDSPGMSGMGLAFDLGATYSLPYGVTVGLAVVDLGFINWNNHLLASTGGPHSVSTDQYTFSADDDSDNSFDNEWDRLADAAADLYELRDMGDQGNFTTGLGATLNASVEVTMPFYDKLTVGLLNTTRLQNSTGWNETRLSLNVAPVKWFALSVTGAVGTFGPSFGGMVSLHPKGISIFAGADCMPTPFSQDGLPLGSNVQANFGVIFPF